MSRVGCRLFLKGRLFTLRYGLIYESAFGFREDVGLSCFFGYNVGLGL
jgi:hypothetical protein